MGCDIHIVLEKKVAAGHWLGIHNFPHYSGVRQGSESGKFAPATDRNYRRFAALAGVRGEGPEANGIPNDASELALELIDSWGEDGHSHSYMGTKEAAQIFKDTEYNLDTWASEYPEIAYFGVGEDKAEFRIIFWFDN